MYRSGIDWGGGWPPKRGDIEKNRGKPKIEKWHIFGDEVAENFGKFPFSAKNVDFSWFWPFFVEKLHKSAKFGKIRKWHNLRSPPANRSQVLIKSKKRIKLYFWWKIQNFRRQVYCLKLFQLSPHLIHKYFRRLDARFWRIYHQKIESQIH